MELCGSDLEFILSLEQLGNPGLGVQVHGAFALCFQNEPCSEGLWFLQPPTHQGPLHMDSSTALVECQPHPSCCWLGC